MNRTARTMLVLVVVSAMAVVAAAATSDVEVLHWWTAGGEAKSVGELKKMLEAKGDHWKDFAVAGGGGENAMTVLKTRVLSGNPPAAAQIKGPTIQEWGDEGVLASIDDVARAGGWDAVLPPIVAAIMKYKGHYVAAPVNVHRNNWLWINPALFAKAGAKVPTNFDEFFAAADKLRKLGVIPVAQGGQPWQDATMFESVTLGVAGVDFYKRAFMQLDRNAILSPKMLEVLETYKRIKPYTDKNTPGRDWNLATGLVINGKAGMQFMGDWAKGEFLAAGKQPGKDFVCVAAPATANSFLFNIDSFVMFKQPHQSAEKGQRDLASTLMSPQFQEIFNLNKGSIPVRANADMSKFDSCAQQSARDFTADDKAGTLLPSWAHGMALHQSVAGALQDVVSSFWNSEHMTAREAQQKLAGALASQ